MFKMATAIIATLLQAAWWGGQLLFALLRGVAFCLWAAARSTACCLWAFLRWLWPRIPHILLIVVIAAVAVGVIFALVAGYDYVRQKSKAEAEAIKCETAFGEAMEAAGEAAEDRTITARVRELVQEFGHEVARRELSIVGDTAKRAWVEFYELYSPVDGFTTKAGVHRVSLAAGDEGTQLRAVVLIDGTEAYLDWCVAPSEPDACPPSPYIYRGIGDWEHLLDKLEARRTTEQKAVDNRFGTIFEETEE